MKKKENKGRREIHATFNKNSPKYAPKYNNNYKEK
jgi:hypothetical protein